MLEQKVPHSAKKAFNPLIAPAYKPKTERLHLSIKGL
jgi:hypothetical protein